MIKVKQYIIPKELQKFVNRVSVFVSKKKIKYKHKLTPSAYTYLSYNHEEIPFTIYGNHKIHPTGRLQVAGPKINENIYVEYDGKVSQLLVEFKASGFYYLFNSSPSKLINKLSGLNNFIAVEVYQQLENDLLEAANIEQQIELLVEFLFERSQAALPFNDYIEKALRIIEEHNGAIHIIDLIKEIGISERQFDRKFRDIIGISPKCYSKIVQLHYVIKLMYSKDFITQQELAYQADYYDLSHFFNRFKELTGFTPNEFLKSDKHIARKYFIDLQK